jgi:hypothetical protein
MGVSNLRAAHVGWRRSGYDPAMSYTIFTVSAVHGLATDYPRAAQELSELISDAMSKGWKPAGGVAIGQTQNTKEPFLFQAMIRP